jgi:hypothetical protein
VELRVFGLVDHTHPAAAKFLDDAVVRDGLADQWRGSQPRDVMLGTLMDASQESWAITDCCQFRGPRFCLQGMVNSVPFVASAMKITGFGTDSFV